MEFMILLLSTLLPIFLFYISKELDDISKKIDELDADISRLELKLDDIHS